MYPLQNWIKRRNMKRKHSEEQSAVDNQPLKKCRNIWHQHLKEFAQTPGRLGCTKLEYTDL